MTDASPLKETSLAAEHDRLGARMMPFAGWRMPVQYDGIRVEHERTRNAVGIFDVSHMGEIRVRGPNSLAALEWMTTNEVAKLKAGEAQYALFPNENGGIVDDLIIYCVKPGEDYLLCVNAANVAKDFAYLLAHNRGAEIIDESASWGQIAVQGPKAIELLTRLFGAEVDKLAPFTFKQFPFERADVLIARTGYTGEDGAEIFVPWLSAAGLWRTLLDRGADLGVGPVGLGARDTLRTEMKYSLYGHEIDDSTNPYEAGLGWAVKPGKKDFVGKSVIMAVKEAGLRKKLIGFEMIDRGIARQGCKLFSFDSKEIGTVTSGTMSPTLNRAVGVAYVDLEHAPVGSEFAVDLRGRKAKARSVATPFVSGTSLAAATKKV